ncbi:MAG: preprotein translocase subunit SecA [Betaproteobacteria bacterium]
MFDLALGGASVSSAYPEHKRERPGLLDRIANRAAGPVIRSTRAYRAKHTTLIERVTRHGLALEHLDNTALRAIAGEVRVELRRTQFGSDAVARSFALVREVAKRTLGMRHFDCQLVGGWILLNGLIAEMETGEGKTLTATLPACTAALAGVPVHIITVNDYLTARDAAEMAPIYHALGLSVGSIVHGKDTAARRAAYGCDITYCTNKEITFDYLRDRIALGRRDSRVQLQLERLASGASIASKLTLRGLFYAIVDEADSVLIDEARTPLIISGIADQALEREMYETALTVAAELERDIDFRIDDRERRVELSAIGRDKLSEAAAQLPSLFRGERRREELVTQALQATYLFQRDTHYLVRDDKIQIIDEFTGRILADRTWEQGLHQMIEVKDGCALSGRQTSVARMTYQRFFRRYIWIAGMTGTAREVRSELWSVYRLPVVRVPTNRPVERQYLPIEVHATETEKWRAIVARVAALYRNRKPVLIGTRSVAASERLSALLDQASIPHQLLNARQDKQEAEIVAQAGQPGRVTVATNMAGRGTDIVLGAGVAELNGLHVIATELHESARIDRQLFGRCGRQGDPGTAQAIVSLEDELIKLYLGVIARVGNPGKSIRTKSWGRSYARGLFHIAQRRAERVNRSVRKELLTLDDQLGDLLAFSGRGE